MNVGERIRTLRKEKGLTQEELGKIIGVQKSAIRKYEAGTVKNIKQEKIKAMADAFNVTPAYLMGWNEFDEKYNPNGELANEVRDIEEKYNADKLPSLTTKDEREVAKALEAILQDYDSQNALAAYNDSDDEEDRELLRASLENTMRLAKRMAKKKFTPKKYRKD